MFDNSILWVGGVFLLGLLGGFIWWVLKDNRKYWEKKKKQEKETAVQKAKELDNFRKQHFVVYIREKDGRKSTFEAALIGALLRVGATVGPSSDTSGKQIMNGDMSQLKTGELILIGTSWVREEKKAAYYSAHYSSPEGIARTTCCDYRLLLKPQDGEIRIIAAGYLEGRDQQYHIVAPLEMTIIDHLITMIYGRVA